MKRTIEVRFRLEGVNKRSKSTANMAMLAEVMRSWSQLIESVHLKGDAPAPEVHKIVAVEVTKGSHNVLALAPRTHVRAMALVGEAVNANNLRLLPRPSWRYASETFGLLKRARQQFRIIGDEDEQIPSAVLRELPRTPKLQLVKGETTFVGKLRSVGGKDPKLRLEVGAGAPVIIDVTEEQARDVAHLLYETIVVQVTAQWDPETAEAETCKLKSWERGPARTLTEGIRIMAEHHGHVWKDVDATAWLRKLRSEEDE